jgi:rubrerythrin
MDFPGRVIAAFIAIILMVIIPLQYVADTSERNINSIIDDCTEQFSDNIRNKGYIDTAMYEDYIEKLNLSGEIYDIEIEDIHPVTGEEVVMYDGDALVTVAHQEAGAHVCHDPECNHVSNRATPKKLSKEMVEEYPLQLALEKDELQSFAAHTHTVDCYVGHRHDGNCSSVTNGRLSDIIFYDDDWGDGYSGVVYSAASIKIFGKSNSNPYYRTIISIGCRNDNRAYVDFSVVFEKYIVGNPITEKWYYTGVYPGNFNQAKAFLYQVYTSGLLRTETSQAQNGYASGVGYYQGYLNAYWIGPVPAIINGSITYINESTCRQAQDENPICNQIVTSITATNPTQTIKKGESLITTATATYLDGHTGIVNCASNFNPNLNGYQSVTLTYSGLVGNAKTTGVRTCTIGVTVINKTLSYITASPATQTIKRNGTPVFSVKAYYSDGTNADIATNLCSISAIDNTTVGQKTINISYTEGGITRSTSLIVYVDDIVAIAAYPSEVTVAKYTGAYSLPITITATYLYTGSRGIASGYTITGYNESIIGRQTTTVSYTENGKTFTTTIIVNVIPLHKTCPICGNSYDLKSDDSDPGCPICKGTVVGISVTPDDIEVVQESILPITVQILYRDGLTSNVTNWTSNYSSNTIGLQFVDVKYAGYTQTIRVLVKEHEITCPVCGAIYPVSHGSCPVCKEKVTGITVVPEEVTVNQYDTISLTVRANYADGSTREVVDWSIDRTSSMVGEYTANVSYGGSTYPIKLTVLSSDEVICSICGLSYDSGKFPNGCPVCSKTITAIEAYLTNGSILVQYGVEPSVTVVLIFLDTHREITDTGYSIEGYDPYKIGMQTITVKYDVFSCLLELEIVDSLISIVCPNGHVYYPNEDGSDPGCPYCVIAEVYEVVYYYDITYTYEILDVLYSSGTYYFGHNNYLNISITKKELSLLKKMQRFSVKTVLLGRRKRFHYGGKVL